MSAPVALLAVRGRVDDVRAWARRGLLPVWVVPDVAWTLVVPAGPPVSAPPYDDPVALLGGRPAPTRLRPSICLVADGPRAVLVVQEKGRRADQRWLVWCQGVGLTRDHGLPHAPVGLLAGVGGIRDRDGREQLREVLTGDGRSGADVADDVLRTLRLPGAGLPLGAVRAGDLPGVVRVDPDDRVVARFDAFAQTEAQLAAQLEDGP